MSNTTIAVIMVHLDYCDMEYLWRNISPYQFFARLGSFTRFICKTIHEQSTIEIQINK